MPTFHLTIKGEVQGVFYRASAAKKAAELEITGWVKNTGEGDVEMMAHGTDGQLKQFIAWCRQGPKLAKVDEVICETTADTAFADFQIIK